MKLSDFKFISKDDAATLLGISTTTLTRRRRSGEWEERVHFVFRNGGYQYNEALLQAWRDKDIDPHGYVNALQSFQQAVEASQKRRRAS